MNTATGVPSFGPFYLDTSDPWRPRWFRRRPGEDGQAVCAADVVRVLGARASEIVELTESAAAEVSRRHADFRSAHGDVFRDPATDETGAELSDDADAQWIEAEDEATRIAAQSVDYWCELVRKIGDFQQDFGCNTVAPLQTLTGPNSKLVAFLELADAALYLAAEAICEETDPFWRSFLKDQSCSLVPAEVARVRNALEAVETDLSLIDPAT